MFLSFFCSSFLTTTSPPPMFPLFLPPPCLGFQLFMVRTMSESLSSAELLKQLKSLGMEKLLLVVKRFLRQSYAYPTLLNFGGKPKLIFALCCRPIYVVVQKQWFKNVGGKRQLHLAFHIPVSFTCYFHVFPAVALQLGYSNTVPPALVNYKSQHASVSVAASLMHFLLGLVVPQPEVR